MTFASTLRLLHSHSMLALRRSSHWSEQRKARYVTYALWSMAVLYLVSIGILLVAFKKDFAEFDDIGFISGVLPIILFVDFIVRFSLRPTPVSLVKPYLLLPISKYACIDSLLINDLLSLYNLLWQTIFLPYSIAVILPHEGMLAFVLFFIATELLVLANGLWYQLVRSLVSIHQTWWALPVVFYLVLSLPLLNSVNDGLQNFVLAGTVAAAHPWLLFAALVAFIVLLFALNRNIDHYILRQDLDITETATGKVRWLTGHFSFAENGSSQLKADIRLELAGIFRNRNPRHTFINCIIILFGISLLFLMTPLVELPGQKTFFLYYCFSVFAEFHLVKIMSYEGNFIDCLMTHKGSIRELLMAKFIVFTVFQIFPIIIFLPTVFGGKCSLIELLSYTAFCSGYVYFVYFQLGVYNSQTASFNSRIEGKNSTSNNYIKILVTLFAMFSSVIFLEVLSNSLDSDVYCLVIGIVGLFFILLSPVWIRNIEKRILRRKYRNINGFYETRLNRS